MKQAARCWVEAAGNELLWASGVSGIPTTVPQRCVLHQSYVRGGCEHMYYWAPGGSQCWWSTLLSALQGFGALNHSVVLLPCVGAGALGKWRRFQMGSPFKCHSYSVITPRNLFPHHCAALTPFETIGENVSAFTVRSLRNRREIYFLKYKIFSQI